MSTPARLYPVVEEPSVSERIAIKIQYMKFIIFSIVLFITTYFNNEEVEQVRLAKEEPSNFAIVKGYFLIFAIGLGLLLFVGVCFAFPMGTEANVYYYHMG